MAFLYLAGQPDKGFRYRRTGRWHKKAVCPLYFKDRGENTCQLTNAKEQTV